MFNKEDKNIIFFDFDNTITVIDVIDDILEKFSSDDRWKELEIEWQKGRIGSRECLKAQIEGVRVDKAVFDHYLNSIKIDPYFIKLLEFFTLRDVPVIIVSDNFDYMINRILENNHITGLKVYCNRSDFRAGALNPAFPFTNFDCASCANCKRARIMSAKEKGLKVYYIGDGRSDVCASKASDVVFAKDYLKDYFIKEGLEHIAIDSLKEVYEYFMNTVNECDKSDNMGVFYEYSKRI